MENLVTIVEVGAYSERQYQKQDGTTEYFKSRGVVMKRGGDVIYGELIGDNRNLFRVINKMKKYLTVAELYEVNKEIADTGYKFLEMEDGEFEMFVTRERNEVSGE